MLRLSRLVAIASFAVLIGAGCGGDRLFTSTNADVGTDPQDLNMPGVPYGTYKQAQGDIIQGQQAEQNWQAQIK